MSHRRNAVRALSLAAFAAVPSLAARGQTWVPTSGTSNWSVGANWNTGTAPVSGTNTVLVFGGSGSDSYTAFQNIADPFILNKLNITTNSSAPIIIGATSTASVGTSTLQFGGTAPAITHSGTGDAFLTAELNVGTGTGTNAVTFNVQNTGRIILLGDIANTTGGITKTGTGTLMLGWEDDVNANIPGRGVNLSLTGEVRVSQGTMQLGSIDGSFLSNTSLLTVDAGATFDFQGNAEDFGSIQGAGTIQTNGAGIRVGLDNRSTTWSGSILGTSASAVINKGGTGTFTVSSAQGYWGVTRVSEGRLVLDKDGSLNQSSEFIVDPGAQLRLDNSVQNSNNRINNTERASGITLFGNSELVLIGNSGTATIEALPPMYIAGMATVTIQPGAGQTATLDSLGLLRVAGGTVLFRGANLGGTGANTANMLFTYAPPLTGANGNAGTTSMSILPYALGDTSATGQGNSLVTYDPATGVRPLNVNTEFATYAAATANDNTRIAAAASGLAGKTVNSLVVHGGSGSAMAVTGTGATPLTIGSGALLFTGTDAITLSGFNSLDFGSAEAIVSVANTHANGATISSPIVGSAGLYKGGSGVLVLNAANTFTGDATINAGTLRFSNDNNLGAAGNDVVFNGGRLQLGADVLTSRGIVSNDGAVGTIDTNGFTLDYRGTFSGAGAIVKTGNGTLLLPEIGTGNTLTFNGGIIRVRGDATTGTAGRLFVLQGSPTSPVNTFDTAGFDAVAGSMSGPGGFIKTGNGTLLIQGTNTFQGDLNLQQGIIKVNGTAGSFLEDATMVTIAAGATLDMSDNSEQWAGLQGAGTIHTGSVTNVDVNVLGTRNTVWTGIITGAGDFVKNGSHTMTVSGASTYTGANDINGGTLVVNASVLPNQASPLGRSAGVISLGNTSGSVATSMLIGTAGLEFGRNVNVRSGNTGLLTLGSNHTSGTSKLSGNVALAKALTVSAAAGGTTEFTGVISGTATAATLTKAGAGTVRLAGVNTYVGATVVNAGTLRIDGSATNSASLTVNATGTFEAGASQTLKSLIVNNNGLAKIATPAAALKVNALTVAAGGKVDVADGLLVVDYTGASPEATVRQALVSGYANGAWSGTGIASTTLDTARQSVGYAEASRLVGAAGGTYQGVTLDGTALVVRKTVAGDATLDGTVNFDDLLNLASAYNSTSGTWSTGDFTYNGVVNFDDLLVLASNYNRSLAAPVPTDVPGTSAAFKADMAAAFAAVPEPSSAAVVLAAAAGFGLSTRRKRRGA